MSAANPFTTARSHLDALGRLLDEAIAMKQPAGEIVDEAMMHLRGIAAHALLEGPMQRMEKTFEVGVPVHTAYSQWKQYTSSGTPNVVRVRFERAGSRRTRVSLAIECQPQSAFEKAADASGVDMEQTAQEFRDYLETGGTPGPG